MNEELQKALGELLNKANDGIDAASGFLAAELPEVIQQLLMWHGVYNFILFIISVIFISVSVTIITKVTLNIDNANHWSVNSKGDDLSVSGGVSIIVSVVLILLSCAFVNMKWLQIWIAPKVWLLEYAASLTK